jgi:hypothetical protein
MVNPADMGGALETAGEPLCEPGPPPLMLLCSDPLGLPGVMLALVLAVVGLATAEEAEGTYPTARVLTLAPAAELAADCWRRGIGRARGRDGPAELSRWDELPMSVGSDEERSSSSSPAPPALEPLARRLRSRLLPTPSEKSSFQ